MVGDIHPSRHHRRPAWGLRQEARVDDATESERAPDRDQGPHRPSEPLAGFPSDHAAQAHLPELSTPTDTLVQRTTWLDRLTEALGTDDSDVLTLRNNIAFWTGRAGDDATALRPFIDLLPDLQRVLGPDHPNVLNTRGNIASLTGRAGDDATAQRLFIEILPDLQRVLGPDHPDVLATRGNIASLTGRAGDDATALRPFIDLLPDLQRVLGPDHPEVVNTQAWIEQLSR